MRKIIHLFKRVINLSLNKMGYVFNKKPKDLTLKTDFERLKNDVKIKEEVKLHFGCGARILKDWINIDLSYAPFDDYLKYYTDKHYPENIRGNRTDLYIVDIIHNGLPFEDNTVDLIFHEDFFEHLTQMQQFIFLAETLRVMKKGAVHRINTPNLVASMRDNSDFKIGKDGVFKGEWEFWHHYNVVTPAVLKEMANMIGYENTIFNTRNASVASHKLPLEYRPNENDRFAPDSNVFADLIK